MDLAPKQQLDADLRALLSRPIASLPAFDLDRARTLVAAAFRHGLAQELVRRLPADAPIAPSVRASVERGLLAQRIQDARLRGALDEAVAALAARGIVPVALKGPALADRVYPDPALRGATDLDLLVEPVELDAAVAAVAARGWRPDGGGFQAAYQRRHHHHVHLGRPGGPDLELHFRANVGFGAVLEAAPLVARARPHRLASGATVLVLAPEDEVLFLAVHATRHLHERLGWLLDLALLIEAGAAGDGETLAARARACRAERALAFTVRALCAVGVPLPSALAAPLGPVRARSAALAQRGALARGEIARDRVFAAWSLLFEAILADRATTAAARIIHHGWWSVRRNAHRFLHRVRRGP